MSEVKYRVIRTARANNIPKTVARIFSYMSSYTIQMAFALLCIITSNVGSVVSSNLFTPIIDDYILPLVGVENPDLTPFIHQLIKIAIIYFIVVVASYLWRKMISIVSTGLLHDIRTALFRKMQKLSIRFFDSHTHGELMNYYTNDVDTIRPLIADTLPSLLSTTITISGVIISMFLINWKLTAISLLSLVAMVILTFVLGKGSRKYFVSIQQVASNINGYTEEMFQGQKVVKVFQHEQENIDQFQKYSNEMFEASRKSNAYVGMLMPANGSISYIAFALVAMVGAQLAINGEITFGQLASFLLLSRQIGGPISNLSQQFNGMMMAISGAERVFDIIDMEGEVDEGKIELVNVCANEDGTISKCEQFTGNYGWYNPQDESVKLLRGDIRLNGVTFGYNPNKIILKDVSLYAKPGQKIAFVGSTGAGKTTITSLINRFYDVEQGTITYDGINVKDIKKDSLRMSLGEVLQDTNLFSGTVLENIRYGNLEATDQQCIDAAKLANADSFIQRLPDGYNTMLTENGANLSQGQRQLLNIARAAVANPPALILDEATSSIDTHTEKLIEKGMDELMAGRTVFVIAHRLSTVRNSNAIIVLEHGQIIERGDHDDLLNQKGRYYQLYTGKAELD